MGSRKSALREERGVTLVLMALMLFLTLGMSALAIDYGMIKAAKAEAQRAMDAAALAGASSFLEPDDPAVDKAVVAEARAREYAAKHDVHRVVINSAAGAGVVDVTVNTAGKKVTASYTSPPITLGFAQLFGSSTMGIKASATAEAAEVGRAVDCVKPFLVPDMWYESNKTTQDFSPADNIWQGGLRPRDGGENWVYEPGAGDRYVPYDPKASISDQAYQTGWGSALRSTNGDYGQKMLIKPQQGNGQRNSMFYLLFDMTPNQNTREEIQTCTPSSQRSVGQEVPIQPGGATGQVRQGVTALMNLDPAAQWNYTTNTVNGSQPPPGSGIDPAGWNWSRSPRVITIALFDPIYIANGVMPGGNSLITINNFARMWLNDVDGNDNVTAVFLGFTTGGASGGQVGPLVKVLRLVK
jgi:hypothetical protein